jgi:hypothetical protein
MPMNCTHEMGTSSMADKPQPLTMKQLAEENAVLRSRLDAVERRLVSLQEELTQILATGTGGVEKRLEGLEDEVNSYFNHFGWK